MCDPHPILLKNQTNRHPQLAGIDQVRRVRWIVERSSDRAGLGLIVHARVGQVGVQRDELDLIEQVVGLELQAQPLAVRAPDRNAAFKRHVPRADFDRNGGEAPCSRLFAAFLLQVCERSTGQAYFAAGLGSQYFAAKSRK
jgi:hypothetical protein